MCYSLHSHSLLIVPYVIKCQVRLSAVAPLLELYYKQDDLDTASVNMSVLVSALGIE